MTIRLHDAGAGRALLRSPVLGAGEMITAGRLTVETGDVMALLDLVGRNAAWGRDNPNRLALWRQEKAQGWWMERNYARLSRRNVAHHYNLDDRLYALMLDARRQYSCGYFARPGMSLADAQTAKLAHIAAKLDLRPGQHVLDIGCGWGGMALFLAKVAGVQVTGITLSSEQHAYAQAQAAATGLADRVRFELRDYRAVTGRFDRIVSVGMFEHVGRPNYRRFFEQVGTLLAGDGVALIHTIGRMGGPGATDPWTRRYIFPGGYSPALSEIMPSVERAALWTCDVEVWRLHYARTLEAWYANVLAHRPAIEALYDPAFFRLWTFYLAAAWSAFAHGDHAVFQLQLARRRDTLPLTRDYVTAVEQRYLALA